MTEEAEREASGAAEAGEAARGPDPGSGSGAGSGLWRRPHVAVPAALSALWLPAMPVYLALTFYAFAWAEPHHFIVDYSWFHEAALRVFGGGDLYADPDYLYPPPAVLLFWPTTWVGKVAGYIASGPMIVAGIGGAFVWALRLWQRETGHTLDRTTWAALLVIGLASAPVFQNLRYAQVNVVLLLAALGALHVARRGRPGWAMVALAGGFWLKLLPLALGGVVLGPLARGAARATAAPEAGSRQRRLARWAAGGVAGLVGLPLALLPWLPLDLYRTYALERVPAISGLTDHGGLSTSIQASLTRLGLPVEAATVSGLAAVPPLATALAGAVGALVVGGATLAVWTGRLGVVRGGLMVLAVLPCVVPLGWEHTFVLAVPLVLVALAEARGPLARSLAAVCALAFFAQRPPQTLFAALVEALPRWCIDLYLARLWLAVLVLIGLTAVRARRAPEAGACPGPRSGGAVPLAPSRATPEASNA